MRKLTLLVALLLCGVGGAQTTRTAMTFMAGPWSPTTSYTVSDVVVGSGGSYVSLATHNLNHPPASSPSQWAALASGGSFDFTAPHTFTALQTFSGQTSSPAYNPGLGAFRDNAYGPGIDAPYGTRALTVFGDPGQPSLSIGVPGTGTGGALSFGRLGSCNTGGITANFVDMAISVSHACTPLGSDPYASIMFQIDGTVAIDVEPDWHMKSHANSGNGATWIPMLFMGNSGAPSSSNCGSGATFDRGSNDGAGRIILGTAPPTTCEIAWQWPYLNETGAGWANPPPNCQVTNEGTRARGTITVNSLPNAGDTVTLDGQAATAGADYTIGATAAATAQNLYDFLRRVQVAPNSPAASQSALTHFSYTLSGSTITARYTYRGGLAGNSIGMSRSNFGAFTISGATLSGATLPATRTATASSGTGGLMVMFPNTAPNANDEIAYSGCTAYW